jgi:hypothetical protein
MKITIETIPHHEQRYETSGDWTMNVETKTIHIRISELSNWKHEVLVAFHELAEVILCMDRGITTEMVDGFDFNFEHNRDVDDNREPGDQPDAPYYKEHFFATNVERMLSTELKVNWIEYEKDIDSLGG